MSIYHGILSKIVEACEETFPGLSEKPEREQEILFNRFNSKVTELLRAPDIAEENPRRGSRCRGVTASGARCKRRSRGFCPSHKHQETLLEEESEESEEEEVEEKEAPKEGMCNHICARGSRAGDYCPKVAKEGEKLCATHARHSLPNSPKKIVESNCKHVFTQGLNQGSMCMKLVKEGDEFCLGHALGRALLPLVQAVSKPKMCSHTIQDGYNIGFCRSVAVEGSDLCEFHKEQDSEGEESGAVKEEKKCALDSLGSVIPCSHFEQHGWCRHGDQAEKVQKDEDDDDGDDSASEEESESDLESFECKQRLVKGEMAGLFCRKEAIGTTHLCRNHQIKKTK